jgi:cyanophycin synthetase
MQLMEGCFRLHETFPDWLPLAPSITGPVPETIGATLVQWALGALNDVRGFLHESGSAAKPGGALLWLGYHVPAVSIRALELALNMLAEAGRAADFRRADADKRLSAFWLLCRHNHPDYQARILMQGARCAKIPVIPFLQGTRFWQFGWGCRSRIFFESMSNSDGSIGFQFSNSKPLTKAVFTALGFPTPPSRLVGSPQELEAAAAVTGWPCVVKPHAGGKGKGVTAGIGNMQELEAAYIHAGKYTDDPIMVEGFVPGDDYRLLVFDGKFFGALRRDPPAVTGDGTSTVRQLVDSLNRERTDNLVKSRYLCSVPFDAALDLSLARLGIGLDSVPEPDRRIPLRSNANISTGGTGTDVTLRVHPDVRLMAETVAKTLGLACVGLDYITENIESSWREGGALIEANTTPGIDGLIVAGRDPVEIARCLLGDLPGRVPFHLVLVDDASTGQAAEKLKAMLFPQGAGWACGSEAAIGNMTLRPEQEGPWAGIRALLHNRFVDTIVAVCGTGEIMRNGMPVDRADRITLCGDLPIIAEWLQVLEEHSGSIEKLPGWEELEVQYGA